MSTTGVFNAILRSNDILLVKRRDLPLWDLPGGRLDDNESIEACATREAQEETGFIVSITEKTGTYTDSIRKDTQVIVKSKIISGEAIKEGPETKELKFFSMNKLPINLVPARRLQIGHVRKGQQNLSMDITENRLLRLLRKVLN
ncbi:NUDIX hydrolase [Marinilactibacillus kalidii]|uniref:NUDIX hydrolase n=1 Tax=Marinilactibacillus kalidii TaxID=2820274 RepID=UPI001ABE8FAF|nr:NUDIX domain-containing protein [Marinilactibacillus kalidii]